MVVKSSINVAVVGSGAISTSVLEMMRNVSGLRVVAIITTLRSQASAEALRDQYAPEAQVLQQLPSEGIDLVVEIAGHTALKHHVLPALRQGIDTVVVSVGALADQSLYEQLLEASTASGAQIELVPGAVGAMDALSAAQYGGLQEVTYTSRKAALAWQDTPAAEQFDLATLTEPTVIFTGTARDATQLYPKNANVAATIALAGLGFDNTQVKLIADPFQTQNEHHISAVGAFGSFELTMKNLPLASNPKTSALTAYSVMRALNNRVKSIVVN